MRRCIAPILRVASAVFHENIVSARPHQAETLVAFYARLPQIGTTSDVLPYAVNYKTQKLR